MCVGDGCLAYCILSFMLLFFALVFLPLGAIGWSEVVVLLVSSSISTNVVKNETMILISLPSARNLNQNHWQMEAK